MSAEFETSLFYISEFQASQGLETETLFQENHKKQKKIKNIYIYLLRLYQSHSFFETI